MRPKKKKKKFRAIVLLNYACNKLYKNLCNLRAENLEIKLCPRLDRAAFEAYLSEEKKKSLSSCLSSGPGDKSTLLRTTQSYLGLETELVSVPFTKWLLVFKNWWLLLDTFSIWKRPRKCLPFSPSTIYMHLTKLKLFEVEKTSGEIVT